MVVPVFPAIIISELLARLYVALGDDEHAPPLIFLRLAIGKAGMIDVKRPSGNK
jgi:hypothetical protein